MKKHLIFVEKESNKMLNIKIIEKLEIIIIIRGSAEYL